MTDKQWRNNGVRIMRAGELSSNTAQTPGMQRRAAVTAETHRGEQALGGNGHHRAQGEDRGTSSR